MPMLLAYGRETLPFQDVAPVVPDFDAYFALERKGGLAILTARVEQALVGLHFWVISTTLHRASVFTASSDLLIVAPRARTGWLAYKLLRESEEGLKARGAVLAQIVPSSHNNFDPLLIRAGYQQLGHCFVKRL